MVFLVHCYVTFRVYIFTASDRLSSRLLRRNHVFYFLFCYWALSAVLFMSWHTRIQGNVPSPQNAHVRRRPGERPHSAVLGHMASLVGKAFCRHFEDRGFLVSQLACRPAEWVPHKWHIKRCVWFEILFKVQTHFVTCMSTALSPRRSLKGWLGIRWNWNSRGKNGSNKPQVFNVTGGNTDDSPELRNCEASWGEPGIGEGEADDYAERLE